MDYAPPISITAPITRLCVEVGTLVGSLEKRVPPHDLALAREIHVEQLRGFVQMGGLDFKQAKAVRGIVRAACAGLDGYDPLSLADLERLNASLAEPLGCTAMWRTNDAPELGLPNVALAPASHARHLLESLFAWYARTDLHPLVASSVFRLEYGYIQPFACASGLTGVLWHHLALSRWNTVFRWCELEQVLLEHEVEWHEAVAESRTRINDAPYVIFMLGALGEALRRLGGQLRGNDRTAGTPERLLAYFAERPQATISEAAKALGVSPRTCARYVAELKQAGKLVRLGSRRSGTWRVV